MSPVRERTRSTETAVRWGVAVGLGALSVYVVAGLVLANWSVADFLARLTAGTLAVLLAVASLAVAVFGAPVAAYLRFGVVSPLVVLASVVSAWLGYGLLAGVLTLQNAFGFAVYAFVFGPFYVLAYVAVGVAEYYVRD